MIYSPLLSVSHFPVNTSKHPPSTTQSPYLHRYSPVSLVTLTVTIPSNPPWRRHNIILVLVLFSSSPLIENPPVTSSSPLHYAGLSWCWCWLEQLEVFGQSTPSHRLLPPRCRTECSRKSFLPAASAKTMCKHVSSMCNILRIAIISGTTDHTFTVCCAYWLFVYVFIHHLYFYHF